MSDDSITSKREQLRARLRQLILMRETGPKRAAWHMARARLIWRLHAELEREAELSNPAEQRQEGASDT
jgi:hypothetical protein